jgi:ABC-2 type transport system ATP-binding protein
MIIKTIMCPKCENQFTIEGSPGEKKYITCSKCKTEGIFIFPSEIPIKKIVTSPFAIEINGLTKIYNGMKAVDNLSFNVRTGEIFGFLGPNGAGKTTTIKALLGLIHTNTGEMKINGYNIKKNEIDAKKKVGYLPERASFYENLTPVQTLNFFCELKGEDKSVVVPLLKEVGLDDSLNKKVGAFSKGMIQLLGITQTMIGKPSIYILDEPTGGLDARWVKIVREKIKKLKEQGATIIFSSHILSEVQALCDRVAIINKGRLIAEDTVSNLNRLLNIKPRLEITVKGLNGEIPTVISNLEGVEAIDAKSDILYVTCESSIRIKVISALEKAGFIIDNIKTIEPSLEDAFVKLIEGDK